MTSQYKEDAPPPDPSGNYATPLSWGQTQAPPYPTQPFANYNIDRTTFGGTTRISEDDTKFAGLCLRCHKKKNLTKGDDKNQPWKSIYRIHQSVKGWGANSEHSYTCSKCHAPHTSGLPRLMITDCLDYKHRGNRVSGGQPWRSLSQNSYAGNLGGQWRGYPEASVLGSSASTEASISCHANAQGNTGTWPDKELWNQVTPW
jgi:hypothetical protein